MKVLYACNFNLKRFSGKDRATRQKLHALRSLVGTLHVVSSGRFRILDLLLIDIRCIYYMLVSKPDVFVSRGQIGLLSVALCKIIGCKSFREVHADQVGEVKYLNKNVLSKLILRVVAIYAAFVDRVADVRIFNHPSIMSWYDNTHGCGVLDFYCYNGFESIKVAGYDKINVIEKYGLDANIDYFVFTGTASKWHGVDYLVDVQRELNKLCSRVKIICAGGAVSSEIDPEAIILNISPLDDAGCDEIISIAKACLLPVRNNRVSPGSPLKLYDYIKHEKFILAQEKMLGYSDEVQRYGKGQCVDFRDAKATAKVMVDLETDSPILINICEFSWDSRMRVWLQAFDKAVRDAS